jgi:hypothetical protein
MSKNLDINPLPSRENSSRRRLLVIFSALVSVAIPIFIAFQVRVRVEHGFSDFQGFYGAGRIIDSGNGPNLYDLATQIRMQRVEMLKGTFTHHYYIHAPFEAILFVPFSKLPFTTAVWAWWLGSLLCAYLSLFVLCPVLPWVKAHLEVGLLSLAIFTPIEATLCQGQDSLLTLLLFAICFGSLVREQYWLAGSVLAIAMYKPPLALPMIILLVITSRKRWKILGGFAVSCVLLFFAAIAAAGWKCVLNYPLTLAKFPTVESGSFHVSEMPNIRGLVDLVLKSRASAHLILLAVIMISIVFLALAVISVRRSGGLRESHPLVFSLFIAVTLLVGFQEYTYDLSLLFIAMLLVWNWSRSEEGTTRNRRPLTYAVVFLLIASMFSLVNPPIYACAMVIFFGLMCRELMTRNSIAATELSFAS